MKTYAEEEITTYQQELEKRLGCPMRHHEAHY
jgi:hypothetical protein